jgi:predicted anti-sigma-YlaC factor YlaD
MSGLTCREFVELVTSHLDEALDPRTESAFVDHLAGCPGCGRYLEQMAQVIRSLRGVVGPA